MQNKILYIEACDFEKFPLGGTLSFAKQFIKNIEEDIFLVGLGNSSNQIGKWEMKELNGKRFNFYSIGTVERVKKAKIPKRIVTFLMLRKHIKTLNKGNFDIVFSQTPQFVFIISKFNWKKFCFCFAGLGNSVGLSRFKSLRVFGSLYEKLLFEKLKKTCDIILAAADEIEINKKRSQYNFKSKKIISFPTRYDDSIFYPESKDLVRKQLGFSENQKIIITTGRLAQIKGWKDLIDSFRIAKIEVPNLTLFFVGDGEDKDSILHYASTEIKNNEIILFGRKNHKEISKLLNAADLFIMTSYVEGWPTSMVEALACGKNIVSSNIGGSYDMIINEENGVIVEQRSPKKFSEAILKALKLPNPNKHSLKIARKYSSSTLNKDFKTVLNGF